MAAQNHKVIFTAVTEGYNSLRPPQVVDRDIDYIVYTNSRIPRRRRGRPDRSRHAGETRG